METQNRAIIRPAAQMEQRLGHKNRRVILFGIYLAVMTLAVIVLSATVIPVAKLLTQRDIENSLQAEVAELENKNSDLTAQISNHRKDSSIEQLAHSEYNLIYPGQQIYVLLP